MEAVCNVNSKLLNAASAPQTTPPIAILPFDAIIYAAVNRPLVNSGAAIWPATQSSEAATVQATPATPATKRKASGCRMQPIKSKPESATQSQ